MYSAVFTRFLSLALLGLAVATEPSAASNEKRAARPNIVFILTDDQDYQMNSLDYMSGVQTHLISQGTLYERHYCTVALCCPSRVNLWTGRAAHNTNVTDIVAPYGGYEKFISGGFNDDWLPVWMQQAGYNTYYTGKLYNSFNTKNYNNPHPNGFNGSDFLVDPGTYNYYNPIYQRNKQAPTHYKMNYTTDLLWQKGKGFMDDARQSNRPFFLTMAPVAPHNGGGPRPAGASNQGPVPAAKYVNYFNNVKVPRGKNFNPDKPSGTSWLLEIEQLSSSQIDSNDEYYRNRLRALQSIDEVVNNTISYLTQHDLIDNTYIIYSADNGFHIGQHRLFPGKNCPYEEDINVPLIIRGPGVAAGQTVNLATTHTDLSPTILEMAGAPARSYLDGSSVPGIAASPVAQNFEHAQIEHWGDAGADDVVNYGTKDVLNTTYKALRIMGDGYNFFYSVWCTNQHELYDMTTDPGQLNNLYTNFTYMPNEKASASNPFPINRLESRLEALLLVLKSCKAVTCIKPWLALHPGGKVHTLVDAMDPKFDSFYEQKQHRISFSSCQPGYIISAEGPQTFFQYQNNAARNSWEPLKLE